jgi:predicted DNA-binding transcriptional regulator AlpA
MSIDYQRQPPSASISSSDRVLTLRQWAELNSLGYRTAQRIIASGNGPKIVQLGDRRIGITEAHNREWQASRVRDRG